MNNLDFKIKGNRLYIDIGKNDTIDKVVVTKDSREVVSINLDFESEKYIYDKKNLLSAIKNWWNNPNVEVPAPDILLQSGFSKDELLNIKLLHQKNILAEPMNLNLWERNTALSENVSLAELSKDIKNNLADNITIGG